MPYHQWTTRRMPEQIYLKKWRALPRGLSSSKRTPSDKKNQFRDAWQPEQVFRKGIASLHSNQTLSPVFCMEASVTGTLKNKATSSLDPQKGVVDFHNGGEPVYEKISDIQRIWLMEFSCPRVDPHKNPINLQNITISPLKKRTCIEKRKLCMVEKISSAIWKGERSDPFLEKLKGDQQAIYYLSKKKLP